VLEAEIVAGVPRVAVEQMDSRVALARQVDAVLERAGNGVPVAHDETNKDLGFIQIIED
jgi:hypothetical protein